MISLEEKIQKCISQGFAEEQAIATKPFAFAKT